MKQPEAVKINQEGIITGFVMPHEIEPEDITPVAIVLFILSDENKVILFKRSKKAGDMHRKWALQSGRVETEDMSGDCKIGNKISIHSFQNAAVREIHEELSLVVEPDRLDFIDLFFMKHSSKKQILFSLFHLEVDETEYNQIKPDSREIEKCGLFTMEEFAINRQLGDAIEFRKTEIIALLKSRLLN